MAMSKSEQGEVALQLQKVQIVKEGSLAGNGNFSKFLEEKSKESGVSVDKLSRFYSKMFHELQDKIAEKQKKTFFLPHSTNHGR